MAEPSRRIPRRPRLFWALFAVVTALGVLTAAGLAFSGSHSL